MSEQDYETGERIDSLIEQSEKMANALRVIIGQSEMFPPCDKPLDYSGYDPSCDCKMSDRQDVEWHGIREGMARAAAMARAGLRQ